jgi:hypothetical protein
MNQDKMGDEAFEALLGAALRVEAAPPSLQQRIAAIGVPNRWLLALVSPLRAIALAGVLSLLLGFAWGWNSSATGGEEDLDMAGMFYVDAGIGEF